MTDRIKIINGRSWIYIDDVYLDKQGFLYIMIINKLNLTTQYRPNTDSTTSAITGPISITDITDPTSNTENSSLNITISPIQVRNGIYGKN